MNSRVSVIVKADNDGLGAINLTDIRAFVGATSFLPGDTFILTDNDCFSEIRADVPYLES